MRKILAAGFAPALALTIAIVAAMSGTAHGQTSGLKNGEQIINLGVGIGSNLGGSGYATSEYETSIPPISVSYERGMANLSEKASIGIGAYAAYAANKLEINNSLGTYGFKYSYTIIGARGNFHYDLVDKLDTYAGLLIGYNIVSAEAYNDNYAGSMATTSDNTIWFAGFVGTRYYFSKNIGAFAELGYGVSYLNLGLTYKL